MIIVAKLNNKSNSYSMSSLSTRWSKHSVIRGTFELKLNNSATKNNQNLTGKKVW